MISIICCTMRQHFIENVFKNYERQDVKEKELIVILNRDDMDQKKWEQRAKGSQGVSIYRLPESTSLGGCLNYGVRKSKYDLIAKFDDDDYYASKYLKRQIREIEKQKADIVCKRSVFVYFEKDKKLAVHLHGEENKFVFTPGGIKGATLVFKKKIQQKVKFPELNVSEDYQFIKASVQKGYKVYTTDKYNYACIRRKTPGHHTWRVRDDSLLGRSKLICKTSDFKPYIQKVSKPKFIEKVTIHKNRIALTFDDGPDPEHTAQILNLLKKHDTKATFFVIGKKLKKHPELGKRIVAEGHDIGNHTYNHPDLAKLSAEEIKEELAKTDRIIKKITGKKPAIFRPPYLSYNDNVLEASRKMGYLTIMRSIETNDYKKPGTDKIVKAVMSKLAPGEIVLMHDSGGDRTQTVEAVSIVLKEMKAKNYKCKKISKLAAPYFV
ncbi:polysaccharide deacetylase family protein [Paenibacillus abyssi]|uniref:NodB homology domain-containing protein n=1 Tax=Paenibacillus abyssi TaxID=1340531 RepID=A0A917CTL9_9BACL|nr:polysaccharide deacetylase family protein [Paenibacillus abyssi]GGF97978.1 hypothetical protein GCM10010916_14020 [Paenibacillus abyssi]